MPNHFVQAHHHSLPDFNSKRNCFRHKNEMYFEALHMDKATNLTNAKITTNHNR